MKAIRATNAVTLSAPNVKVSAAGAMTAIALAALARVQHVKTTSASAVSSGVTIAAGAAAPAALMKMKGVITVMKKNLERTKERTRVPGRSAVLLLSPTAWAKLLFLRDAGDTEIGGFAISAADDLLFVKDVQLVRQTCTWLHVEFDDDAVADFFDRQVDAGRRPEEFGRIWVHTHPGSSPEPSQTDEVTFTRVFGNADWALMFILARGGQTYARLRYNCGPGADLEIPMEVDYGRPFAGSDSDAWQEEYCASVRLPEPKPVTATKLAALRSGEDEFVEDWWRDVWGDYADFDQYQPRGEHGFIGEF